MYNISKNTIIILPQSFYQLSDIKKQYTIYESFHYFHIRHVIVIIAAIDKKRNNCGFYMDFKTISNKHFGWFVYLYLLFILLSKNNVSVKLLTKPNASSKNVRPMTCM